MGLEDLQKKIYRPEPEFEDRPLSPSSLEPGERYQEPKSGKEWPVAEPSERQAVKSTGFFRSLFSFTPGQKKYFLIGGSILFLLLVGLIIFVYWYGRISFDRTWVKLDIAGPDRVVSGESVIYIVKYQNNTKVALNDAEMIFYWPENSISDSGNLIEKVNLGTISSGESKEIEFKGKVIGAKGTVKEVKATLNYQPAKTRARFENVAALRTDIISVPLVLSFDMPEKVSSGQQITVSLKYLNDSDSSFENLVIKIEYPDGFKVSSTYPQPQENIWQIGMLDSKQEGKVLVTGIIEGNRGENKTFRAYLGVIKESGFASYTEIVKSAQIALPVLALEQTINDSYEYIASAGEYLNYKIKYQNTSHLGVPAVKITSTFFTNALDFTTLELRDIGSFDSTNNTITWDQSSVPELEFLDAGKSGELTFTVKVKDSLPIKTYNDKDFTIRHVISSNSANIPLALSNQQVQDTSERVIKINTKLGIEAKGVFEDTILPNSGPIPPKVGQTTTYTLYWQITNTANDVEDVKVEAVLPPNVSWLNNYNPTSAVFRYDSLNRKLVWQVGKLAAGTGNLSPAKYVAFQLALTPSAPQVGQVVEILKQSTISGKDTFTGTNLEISDAPITSDMRDDPTMSWEKGRVIQ